MPHIGPTELIIILAIILIIFGVGRLPEIGSAMGKAIRGFRKATSDEEAATSTSKESKEGE
jgi:sec-independent protein translocase protein TatA